MTKTFKGSKAAQELSEPAMQFITQEEDSRAPAAAPEALEPGRKTLAQLRAETPAGYKVNPVYIEKKSKRVQLVMQPSLFDRAKAEAERQGVSFNEYVHEVLQDALERLQED